MQHPLSALKQHLGMLAAGAVAAALFLELFIRVIGPAFGVAMDPPMLLCAVIAQVLGLANPQDVLWLAEAGHYALSLLVFPLGYILIAHTTIPGPPVLRGSIWGGVLGLAAMYVWMPIAGFGVGSGTLLVGSMIAHIAYGAILGLVVGFSRSGGPAYA